LKAGAICSFGRNLTPSRLRSIASQKAFPQTNDFVLLTNFAGPQHPFRLTSQRGKGRASTAELCQFLVIARGSIEETRYLILLARDLTYISPTDHEQIESACTEVSKMTNALLRSLR
jgi:hypothetical protein